MNAEIICIAADNLPEEHSGFLTSYISKKLFELGHRTTFEKVCAPEKSEVEAQMKLALGRSDLVIVLGGIEPETNSIAKTVLSNLTDIPLSASEEALDSVRNYCRSLGVEPTPEHLSASITLKGATVFKNELGLCPGLCVETASSKVLLLPYAKGELSHMFDAFISPLLCLNGISATHTVNVIGLSAEAIEKALKGLSGRSEYAINIEKHQSEYAVRISTVADTKEEAEAVCSKAVASVKFALGKSAYAIDSNGIQYEAVKLLREKGLTVSTAESCTAGMVSEMLTDVGGSSAVFEYGISAYSNRIKSEVLRIPESIIEKYSAISYETAKLMAINIRALSGATLGIGITGNAGPAPSENKPVGLVFVALADSESYIVKELNLSSALDRDEIRSIAASEALDLVRRYALSHPDTLAGMKKYEPISFVPAKTEIKHEPVVETDLIREETSAATSRLEKLAEETSQLTPEYTMVFDRESDENYFDENMAQEYEFTKGFRIPNIFENINIKDKVNKVAALFKGIFPSKADSPKKITLKIAFFISLIAFITSASVLWYQLSGDEQQRDIIMQAQTEWHSNTGPENTDASAAFEPLYEKNEDIKGWITIGGTMVDNPIYQTTDNDYYLTHNMYKEKSRYGALFFDYRCNLSAEEPSQNLTVYGHEMKDGSMFGTLKKYKSLSFYKQNPSIDVALLEKKLSYKIFSVMVLNATPEDDNGYIYNYTAPSFSSQKSFLSWINEARERSIINTDVDVKANDQIITLVTCINDFDNARFVIMGRLVRENEDSRVDTQNAALNPNPRYPQAWYDKRGLEGYVDPNSSEDASSDTVSSTDTSSDKAETDTASDTVTSDVSSENAPVSSTVPQSSSPATSNPTSSAAASIKPSASAPAGNQPTSSVQVSSSTVSSSTESPSSNTQSATVPGTETSSLVSSAVPTPSSQPASSSVASSSSAQNN